MTLEQEVLEKHGGRTTAPLDNYDILRLAKKLNKDLKLSDNLFGLVFSDVTKVSDDGFYITPRLEIAVASAKNLAEHKVPLHRNVLEDIYYAALSHENAHAIIFPFMTRINLTYAVVHGYCKSRGVDFNTAAFNQIENIVSDIFNELVVYTNKREGYRHLPKLRYYYIYLPRKSNIENKLRDRARLEKNPLLALFTTHNLVFASIYRGKLKKPRIPKPSWLSEHLYNTLYGIAKEFDIEKHIELLVRGGFSATISRLIYGYNMYRAVDTVYTELKTLVNTGKVKLKEQDFRSVSGIINNTSLHGPDKQYWSYYTLLMALYRITIENTKNTQQVMNSYNVDDSKKRPGIPDPDTLEQILNQMNTNDILAPGLADFVARKLISVALLTAKTEFEISYRSGTTKIPWYRRPRGKIDPLSLLKPSVLDWKVQVSCSIPEYRRVRTSSVGLPDRITVIIDESGSTGSMSSILSRIVGVDTTVFDVERTTVMSLLYNVLRHSEAPKTTLVRFSSRVIVETGTVKEIYERLKNIRADELQWGSTEIEKAVEEAVSMHRDKATNYFLLATDMEIDTVQAEYVRDTILSKITRSPVLILAANAGLPKQLEELNRYPNVAAVSVKTMADYPKLEEAVKKLARLIMQ